ncbi:MAG: hypothetical protein IKE94_11860 [Aeriscardovia sp.]|nr:hypothetical protein [Aeriscardovia sp.]
MNIKLLYAKVLAAISRIAGVDAAKKFDAQLRFRKKLNLKNPTSLSDKVSFLELHDQSPLASTCTDKYEVRKYLESKGLGDHLVPLVGGPWENVSDVDFDSLPNSFVIKATHGCKMNFLVPDKNKMDIECCRKEMARWIATTYGGYSMELHYLSIPHRIYAECFLENANDLIDYKFHCFNGKPEFVLVCSDRKSNGDAAMKVTLDLFDLEWNHIPELIPSGSEVAGDGSIPKPQMLGAMIDIAKKLAVDFKFVRVDLYELNGKVYFGELTFSPGCCVFPYFTNKFDLEMGKKLIL